MTLLDTIANGLLAADRALRARRPGATGAWVMPVIGTGDSVTLVGEGQTITYADIAETHPVVHAVISKLVRSLVTLGVDVYRRDPATRRLVREHDTDLEEVLQRPAPGCGLLDLLQWIYLPALVEGNSVIGKYRSGDNDGRPTGLVPLDWRYLSAFARPGGPVEYWMSMQIGEPRVLDPSEVVHVAWRSAGARPLGASPLRALASAVRVDDAAQRFQQASLANAARPAGALVFPPDSEVTAEEKEALREEVRKLHGGVDNAFRLAILSGGLDWKPMSFTAAQAELDATRSRSREEICVAYDVRWSQIADSPGAGGGGRAVAELARDFHRTLRPWAALAESAIQRQLIDPEPGWQNLAVRFDFSDLLRGSPQEELNNAVHAYVNGLADLDEARSMVKLAPFNTPESRRPLVPHAQLQPPDGRALPPSSDPAAARSDIERDRQ